MRGQGTVYRPGVKRKDGTMQYTRIWWLSYSVRGEPKRESSHTRNRTEALRILRERIGAREAGKLIGTPDRVSFTDLRALAEARYQADGRKSADRLGYAFDRLEGFFGADRAIDITPARLDAYALSRRGEGAASATINRELSALRLAFRLAVRLGVLATRPEFQMAKEENVRTGFFEDEDFDAVVRELPSHLKPVIRFAYLTGWRKGEILKLTWTNVDLTVGMIRLEPGTTKSGDGRTFPFHMLPELDTLIRSQWEGRDGLFVFHRRGQPIRDFYGAWKAACERAAVRHVDGREIVVRPGLRDRILHDFRRTAVRNLVRAGVSEQIAMRLTGHKTRAVFDRYDIVSERDLAEGVGKLAVRSANIKHPSNISSPAATTDRVTSGAA